MSLSRRKFLVSGAAGAVVASLALSACSPAEVATFQQSYTNFIGQVQSLVAKATGVIPTVEGVATTVASLFGPQWATAVALTSSVVNTVVSAIKAAMAAAAPTPAASARFRAALRTSSPSIPIVIGTLPNGQIITGYRARG